MTNKQKNFIEEYLACFNATRAAKAAGYSEKTAYSIGHENLNKPEIKKRIHQRLTEKAMSADEVLMRLADQARADISDFIKKFGAIDWEAVQEKGYLVKKVSHRAGKQSSIELYDAQAALEKLARAHGLFLDKQEITGKDGGPVIIRVVRDGTASPPKTTA